MSRHVAGIGDCRWRPRPTIRPFYFSADGAAALNFQRLREAEKAIVQIAEPKTNLVIDDDFISAACELIRPAPREVPA